MRAWCVRPFSIIPLGDLEANPNSLESGWASIRRPWGGHGSPAGVQCIPQRLVHEFALVSPLNSWSGVRGRGT